MCGQVIYPAAVLKNSAHPEEAAALLAWQHAPDGGMPVFERAGFTAP